MFCISKNNNSLFNVSNNDEYVIFNNNTNSYFPRHIQRYVSIPNLKLFKDNSFQPTPPPHFKFTSTLRNNQKEIANRLIEFYEQNGHIEGIIHASGGIGKTVLSVWWASYIQQKTLILIDTKNIIDQWRERILEHSSLNEEQIGLIKGNVFDVEDKAFIITTPQTLASKAKSDIKANYKLIRDLGIGLVIWDECHKMGNIYASSSLFFNTPNVLGLSATPYNPFERDNLIKGIFGDILIKHNHYDFQPTIKFIPFDSGLGEKYGNWITQAWEQDFIKARSSYNARLTESNTWIKNICDITKREVDSGNRIIIICMTQKQLNFIYKELKKIGVSPVKLYSKEHEIDKKNNNAIVATYKYASHAFDYKELNRLLLAVPLMGKKSLIQSVCRIVRYSNEKSDAIVYDLIDMDEKFNGLFRDTIGVKINILKNEFKDCKFENF